MDHDFLNRQYLVHLDRTMFRLEAGEYSKICIFPPPPGLPWGKKSCPFVYGEYTTVCPRSLVSLCSVSAILYGQEVVSLCIFSVYYSMSKKSCPLVYVKYTTVWPRRCVPLYVLNLVYGEYTSLCPRSLVPLYTVSVLQYVKEDLSLSIC